MDLDRMDDDMICMDGTAQHSTAQLTSPPLSPTGTLDNPIVINAIGDEQFAGCTGCPADSHVVRWLRVRLPPPPLPPTPTSKPPPLFFHIPHPSQTPLHTNTNTISHPPARPPPPRRALSRMRRRLPHELHRPPRRPTRPSRSEQV